ncbi:uncharacterized mitochondrial protein AtMg00810-like [Lactuca sativa]|uniref:uncharacterized mitochondrial protein AtMg00810-like n=1 Tax=Lactuca sativa TaxID=4236 RepID=UPI0022AE65B8|nr:uncharacterized mitochondrial protein AtMg00810-like [Lactuca sativa]
MTDDLHALETNNTWSVVPLPADRKALGFAKLVTVKLLLALAAQHSWPLLHLDVNNAFLNGSGSTYVVLLVYVDDIVLIGVSLGEINLVKDRLSNEFKLKDLGNLKHFLGLEIARSKQGIVVSQRKYTLDLLQDTGKLATKTTGYPMDPKLKISNFNGDPLDDPAQYRRLIGRLMYLTITRPDITYAVHRLSQYITYPKKPHMEAVTHLLRYLKHNPGQGLFLSSKQSLQLRAFSDSDWAGCPNTRRSITRFCIFIGDSLISWKSKKQTIVSRSFTEAEYRALAATTSEIIWLKHLLQAFKIDTLQPTLLFCDNESAIKLASNPIFHERTKHIELDCHFIRDKVIDKTIKLMPIRSQRQLADVFTKPLPKAKM